MKRKSKYDCTLKCLLCIYLYKYLVYWVPAFPIIESIFTCVHRNVLSDHMCVRRVWCLCLAFCEQFRRSCSITSLYTYFPNVTRNSSWYLCCEGAVLIVLLVHLRWQAGLACFLSTHQSCPVGEQTLSERAVLALLQYCR